MNTGLMAKIFQNIKDFESLLHNAVKTKSCEVDM